MNSINFRILLHHPFNYFCYKFTQTSVKQADKLQQLRDKVRCNTWDKEKVWKYAKWIILELKASSLKQQTMKTNIERRLVTSKQIQNWKRSLNWTLRLPKLRSCPNADCLILYMSFFYFNHSKSLVHLSLQ